ncbi:MAG TPA: PEP-CTERM sorting domain-containing protein [Vicinamibacterales bacterium]|nr:PEP-CTERM sorting domain-containing protein [Vicinamibacterales bacterium]
MLLAATPGSARALPITIGAFSFADDLFFGSVFQVDNTSQLVASELGTAGGVTFTAVTVTVETDGVIVPIALGDISPGSSAQTSFDFSTLTILSATLTLGLTPSLALPVVVAPLAAPVDGDTTPITVVPEPGTLLLLSGGVAALGLGRRRRARRRPPAARP